MKKRLLTLLLGLIGLTATALAENYNLYICNVQVTSSNCNALQNATSSITQGTMTYDPASSTLTLTDVVMAAGANTGINLTGIDNFTLKLVGENTITNTTTSRPGLEFGNSKNVTITGSGSLSVTSPCYDIMYLAPSSERTITLTGGASLNLLGYGLDDNGDNDGKLIVDGANLFVKRSNGHCFLAIRELEVRNADIVQPADASQYTWIYQSFYKDGGNGAEYTGDIEIKTDLGQEAQGDNPLNTSRYDVDGNGAVTLGDLTLLANALVGRVNYPVTSLTLSPSSASLLKGTDISLIANVQPAKADYHGLLWKTSNRLVATVDATGKVVGQGTGMCTITAQTLDGSNLSASCNVTVVDPSGTADGYVDLGLPSGTLWASCNLGATKPEEYGDYFAWGETEPYAVGGKTTFSWSTYKFCNGDRNSMTKYCTDSNYGTVDNLTELLIADDAANAVKGGYWRMPTAEQCVELINPQYTTWSRTTLNGVYGLLVTSIMEGYEGNSIFLPAAGSRNGGGCSDAGSYGCYWARTLDSTPCFARGLFFGSDHDARTHFWATITGFRYAGNVIRPVWKQ